MRPHTRFQFKYLLPLFLICIFVVGLTIYFLPRFSYHAAYRLPKPIAYQPKSGTVASGGQLIFAQQGGQFTANDVTIQLPPKFRSQDTTVTYHEMHTDQIKASSQVSSMFDLHARTKDGTDIHTFDKPLQIVTNIPDDAVQKYGAQNVALYFFDTKTNQWEKLPSTYDAQKHQLIATTTHFTIFMVAGSNPNAGVTQPPPSSGPVIVDDQDPGFTPGFFDEPGVQPSFMAKTGLGYHGNSQYTYNSISPRLAASGP